MTGGSCPAGLRVPAFRAPGPEFAAWSGLGGGVAEDPDGPAGPAGHRVRQPGPQVAAGAAAWICHSRRLPPTAATDIAVRWPTAATSSWLRRPKMSPTKTSSARSTAAAGQVEPGNRVGREDRPRDRPGHGARLGLVAVPGTALNSDLPAQCQPGRHHANGPAVAGRHHARPGSPVCSPGRRRQANIGGSSLLVDGQRVGGQQEPGRHVVGCRTLHRRGVVAVQRVQLGELIR
jgi:hypothetical protein